MKILMTPVGSAGDVHPFIGIGRGLVARGHDVVLITSGPFRETAERAGLRFVETLTRDEYDRMSSHPDLWDQRKGLKYVLHEVGRFLPRAYELMLREYEPGLTLIVGHTLGFAARTFEELHRAPAVTIQLAPAAIRTVYATAAYHPRYDLSRLPIPAKRALWWVLDRAVLDPQIAPALNRWRRDLGLPPVASVFGAWMNSPQGVVALFPEWFGPRQPDWPANLHLTGFPRYDESDQQQMGPDLRAWLDGGDPPIVFTPGSAHRDARKFFSAAVDAARILGRRALLLTRYSQQIPARRPETVRYEPYVPFSQLLPRSAALVHHGGIGTCAQGLGAGVPQLTMPLGFDQPDNTARLVRLGVARWILPRAFTGPRVARALKELLTDASVARACRVYAELIARSDPITAACDAIESAVTVSSR
ncbi:MAG TPA: nucleotide disphospho-sugar-binding domain-containing protein [Vicinamibacterales bacterium]|nr:nucleotide disphospho-sugar-binding domain-containing protein [Vicinamibacterales bacterium]